MNQKGVTLLELLAVIIILGIITAMIVPAFLSSNERIDERVVYSQLESVFHKAQSDAQTLGETVELEVNPHNYVIYSAKRNPEERYYERKRLVDGYEGMRVMFDERGAVEHRVNFRFEVRDQLYEVEVLEGRSNILIDGISVEEWKVRHGVTEDN